jgi:hypothetical protein
MKKVYYSKDESREIVDLRGDLPHPGVGYEAVELEDDEVAYFDGSLKKKKSAESEEVKAEKKNTRKADKQFTREKLNLTKPEMKRFAAGLKAHIEDNGEE